jgi:hypothetical protein
MVIALAGRRIDAPDASEPRFPLAHVPLVEERVRGVFADTGATALVSSAACGADLIAQLLADRLHLHRRVVLPFDAGRFRDTSVTDRPGDWGPVYDRLVRSASDAGELVILDAVDRDTAYAAANQRILDEAEGLADELGASVVAVVVWNGHPRGSGDLTAEFRDLAAHRGLRVLEVRTV